MHPFPEVEGSDSQQLNDTSSHFLEIVAQPAEIEFDTVERCLNRALAFKFLQRLALLARCALFLGIIWNYNFSSLNFAFVPKAPITISAFSARQFIAWRAAISGGNETATQRAAIGRAITE